MENITIACCERRLHAGTGLITFAMFVFASFLTPRSAAGQSISVAAVGPSRVDFGAQMSATTSEKRVIILINAGVDPMPVTRVAVAGDFQVRNECPKLLPAGQECRIWVTFKPSMEGVRAGRLTINDDAGTQTVVLLGKGTPLLNARK